MFRLETLTPGTAVVRTSSEAHANDWEYGRFFQVHQWNLIQPGDSVELQHTNYFSAECLLLLLPVVLRDVSMFGAGNNFDLVLEQYCEVIAPCEAELYLHVWPVDKDRITLVQMLRDGIIKIKKEGVPVSDDVYTVLGKFVTTASVESCPG